jgi:hypothetical protein
MVLNFGIDRYSNYSFSSLVSSACTSIIKHHYFLHKEVTFTQPQKTLIAGYIIMCNTTARTNQVGICGKRIHKEKVSLKDNRNLSWLLRQRSDLRYCPIKRLAVIDLQINTGT